MHSSFLIIMVYVMTKSVFYTGSVITFSQLFCITVTINFTALDFIDYIINLSLLIRIKEISEYTKAACPYALARLHSEGTKS